jgi:hypothetical protein
MYAIGYPRRSVNVLLEVDATVAELPEAALRLEGCNPVSQVRHIIVVRIGERNELIDRVREKGEAYRRPPLGSVGGLAGDHD